MVSINPKSNRGVSPSGHIPAHLLENSTPAICGSMFWPRRHEAGLVRPETSMALCSFCHFRTDSELSSLVMVCRIDVVFSVCGGIVEGGGIVGSRSSLRVGREGSWNKEEEKVRLDLRLRLQALCVKQKLRYELKQISFFASLRCHQKEKTLSRCLSF